MGKYRKRKILCRTFLTAFISISLLACGQKAAAPELLEPVEVKLSARAAERKDICDITVYAGNIKPCAVSYAFPDACRIEEIKVHLGEYVKTGQILAVRYCSDADKEEEQLKREVEWLKVQDSCLFGMEEADLAIAQMELDQMIITSKDTAEERSAIKETEKAVEARREQAEYESGLRKKEISVKSELLESYAKKTDNRTLIAEEDGYVSYVKEFAADNAIGKTEADEIVIILSDHKEAYVAADIVGAKVKEADRIYMEVEGKQYPLVYSPYSDSEKRMAMNQGISLEARFLPEDGSDLTGMIGKNATVYLVSNEKKQALSVAPDALFQENGEYFVYLLQDGKKIRQSVTPGVHTKNAIEITEGIEEGDMIYYPVNDMPGNSYSLQTLKEEEFVLVKKYDQTKVRQPAGVNVLVKPEAAVLKELLVKNGDAVQEGDTLAVLSTEEGGSRLEEYGMELSELENAYNFQRAIDEKEADKKQKRMEAMVRNKTEGTLEYKRLALEYKKLQLQMELAADEYAYQTKSILEREEEDREKAGVIEVKAPAAGKVTELVSSAEGYSIPKDTLLCRIADEGFSCIMMYAEGEIIPTQGTVTIDLYQSENDLEGTVICSYQDTARSVYNNKRILKENNPQMVNVSYVLLKGEASYDELKAFGIEVKLWDVDNAIRIPLTAIYNEGDRRYVWLMNTDGQMEKRYVSIGFSDGRQAWIIQGLDAGEEMIAEN